MLRKAATFALLTTCACSASTAEDIERTELASETTGRLSTLTGATDSRCPGCTDACRETFRRNGDGST
jgi:hypothetical protein